MEKNIKVEVICPKCNKEIELGKAININNFGQMEHIDCRKNLNKIMQDT